MKRERRLASGDEDWEIRQDGAQLLIDDGAKQVTRKFVSIDHASVQFDKLVAGKVEAGFVEATARRRPRRAAQTDTEPRDPALEAAVLANRTDRDACSVYGDWYEARGHPRGALIAMQLDDRERYGDETRAARIHRHLQHHKAQLLGPLAQHILVDGDSPFEWFGGFIHGVELVPHDSASPQQILREVVAHASGRLLANVTAVITKRQQASSVIGALRKHPILSIRLVTDKGLQGELAQLRSLTTLRRFALSVVQCPSDERPYGIETSAQVLRALCELPSSVEHLELRIDDTVEDPAALAPLFRREDLHLRTLALRAPTVLAAMLDPLLTAPWAATLETLDAALISAERLWDVLLANRDRFPALEELRLTASTLTSRRVAELREHYRVVDERDDYDVGLFEDSVGEEYFFRPISE